MVACGDFTANGKKLIEFAHLKNTCIDSEQNGYETELSSILQAIEEQTLLPSDKLREFFWDMFIADALLGNFDRHNGNWGVLVDERCQTAEIAPVYDRGSCLYPQMAADDMRDILNSEEKIQARIYTFPASIIKANGKKTPYFKFISSLKNVDCNEALRRVHRRIDMVRLYEILEENPMLAPIQKEFYQIILRERKEKILDYSIEQLLNLEQNLVRQKEQQQEHGFEMTLL